MAILDQNVVYLGSDSASTDENNTLVTRKGCSKSWMVELPGFQNVLVGFSGMFATGTWIRYGFSWPKKRKQETMMEYLVRQVQPSLKKSLEERFADQESRTDWEVLVAYPKHIFKLQPCGNVEESILPYNCIGNGQQLASGVLHYSLDFLTPWESMEKAYEICKVHCTSIAGPFYIHALTENGIFVNGENLK